MSFREAIVEVDRILETPAQETLDITQDVLKCSEKNALRVVNIANAASASFLNKVLSDEEVNFLLNTCMLYLFYYFLDLFYEQVGQKGSTVSEEVIDDDQILKRVITITAVLGSGSYYSISNSTPEGVIIALSCCFHRYLISRYHDTGSKMRDFVKSKVSSVLSSSLKVEA